MALLIMSTPTVLWEVVSNFYWPDIYFISFITVNRNLILTALMHVYVRQDNFTTNPIRFCPCWSPWIFDIHAFVLQSIFVRANLFIQWNLDIASLYIAKSLSSITNHFLHPRNSKIYQKGPGYNQTLLKPTNNFASPLALCYIELPLYIIFYKN